MTEGRYPTGPERGEPVTKLAMYVPMSGALLEDALAAQQLGRDLERSFKAAARRWANPSDPNPFPRIRLFRWLPR